MAELTLEELRQLAVDAAKAANPTAKQEDIEAHIPSV